MRRSGLHLERPVKTDANCGTPVNDPQAWLAAIVEHSYSAIYTKTLDGVITAWNGAAERIYGYTAEEIVGRPVWLLADPEYHAELARILQQVAAGEPVSELETVRRSKDGRKLELSVTVSPVRNAAGEITGASVIARDISEKKAAERKLERSEAELRAIMEAIPELVWTAGSHCRLEFRNQRWMEYLPASAGQSAEASWQAAVHPEDLKRVLGRWDEALRTGQAFQCEFRVRARDGSYRWFLAHAVPVPQGSEAPRWFGTCSDVEDFKRAQAALVATEKLASAGRMAGTIAHEINNPLQAIGDLVFLLSRNDSLNEAGQELVRALHGEVNRISHITRQTLGLYREATSPVEVDLREALHDVLDLHKRKLMAKKIRLQRWFQGSGKVHGYPVELRQVFSNLIDNALDAMSPGGKLEVVLDDLDGEHVRVRVRDDGSGVPEMLLKRIFDPFFSTKGEKGTGVGLWVTHGIVSKHGGTIRVRSDNSQKRHGTEFELVFPVKFTAGEKPAELAAGL